VDKETTICQASNCMVDNSKINAKDKTFSQIEEKQQSKMMKIIETKLKQ